MSFNAVLKFEDKEFTILHSEYDFTQPTNSERQPIGRTVAGFINLTIETSNDALPIEWVIQREMMRNGEIVFYRTDSHSVFRRIEFENAFCVYYKEIFDTYNDQPMVIMLRLSPQVMRIEGQSIMQEWTIAASQSQSAPAAAPSGSDSSSFIAD